MIIVGRIIAKREFIFNNVLKHELQIVLNNTGDGSIIGEMKLPVKAEWYNNYVIGMAFKVDASLPVQAPPPKSKGLKKVKGKKFKAAEATEELKEDDFQIEVELE